MCQDDLNFYSRLNRENIGGKALNKDLQPLGKCGMLSQSPSTWPLSSPRPTTKRYTANIAPHLTLTQRQGHPSLSRGRER